MRRPEPWYRTSKGAWYVQVAGKKHRLAKGPKDQTRDAAYEAFYALMAARPEQLPPPEAIPVAVVCDHFLGHSEQHHTPGTYKTYRYFLRSFARAYGRSPAAALKPFHVTRWLDANPTWKASRRHAGLAVKRALAWADRQGLVSPSTLRGMAVEPGNRRDRVLTPGEQAEVLAAIKDQSFRDLVFAMIGTGCRPSEVARVTAADVDLERGVWVLREHKTARKTGRPRIIYLSPAMVELTRRLVAEAPAGPLFRGPRGKKPYTRNGIRCRFRRLRAKLPHLPPFVAYNLRHTFAIRALVNGVGVAQVAELLGHTTADMVSRVYGHLAGEAAHLRDAAARAASPPNA